MGNVLGSFSLPTAQRTSQLINDTRFSSIQEYILDYNSLSGSTQIDITDILPGSVIYRIDLIILSAFSDLTGSQHDIEISCNNGNILMDKKWNDPNMIGTYTTNCYVSIRNKSELIHINHSYLNHYCY